MRVLIVNTSERRGGAAVAANRLTRALISNGVAATMLVMNRDSAAPYVAECGGGLRGRWHFLRERLGIFLANRLSRKNLFTVSTAASGTDITVTPEFQQADIVHLHWVNQGFLSVRALRKILDSGKPVVWTMHDLWPATAICQYPHECTAYHSSCHHCPFLRHPGKHDLSARVFVEKQRMYAGRTLHLVAVSRWERDQALKSALVGHMPIEVIANAFPVGKFTLWPRLEARRRLGLPSCRIILFGAARIDAPIKGFAYLCEAVRLLLRRGAYRKEELRIMVFGKVKDAVALENLPVECIPMGFIKDEARLSDLYSAADVYVASSLYETFGQTLVEAQACGCTPVTFANSGQSDIVQHMVNGYVAEYKSAESLADGIAWALQTPCDARQLRQSVERRFSEDVIARKHIDLYNNSLLAARANA